MRQAGTGFYSGHPALAEGYQLSLSASLFICPLSKSNESGESVDVHLMPLVAASHTFYCSNKLLFMDSHRKQGMEGKLTVIPWEQVRHVDE
jgi:hypothetical protein